MPPRAFTFQGRPFFGREFTTMSDHYMLPVVSVQEANLAFHHCRHLGRVRTLPPQRPAPCSSTSTWRVIRIQGPRATGVIKGPSCPARGP